MSSARLLPLCLLLGISACVNVPSGQGSGEGSAHRAYERPCTQVWNAALDVVNERGNVPEITREGVGGEIRAGGIRVEVKQIDDQNTLLYVNVAKWAGQDFQDRAESIADQISERLR